MSKLIIAATTDFTTTVLDDVSHIAFGNPAGTLASGLFAMVQFSSGSGGIRSNVAIEGSAGINRLVVTGNSIFSGSWSFDKWEADDEVIFRGTQSFDEAFGSVQADRIVGFDGDDFMFGLSGDDKILGGSGADRLVGGEDDDVVRGGRGRDDIQGDSGRNILGGGVGRDRITSNCGDGGDRIDGGAGFDELDLVAETDVDLIVDLRGGGQGRDIGNGIRFSSIELLNFDGFSANGDDIVTGGSGDDFILGGKGNDRIRGGAGADHLIGGEGVDLLHGGTGDDLFIISTDAGIDKIFGGGGVDSASILGLGFAGLTIDISDGGGGRDIGTGTTLSGIDRLVFHGGKGNDQVAGGSGEDLIGGGGGLDLLTGGDGDDVFVFSRTASRFSGATITDFSQGNDVLDLSGIDATPGVSGNSFIFIADNDFSNRAGELRYSFVGGETIVQADLTGEGKEDFFFTLSTEIVLEAADFLL